MSYSVYGYIVKESDKLNILIDHGYAYKITNGYAFIVKDLYANLNKEYENIGTILKSIGVDKYVEIDADYFGGCGEQHSIVHNLKDLSSTHKDSINDGLIEIGVCRTADSDEFDIVGLGSIRGNDDVIPHEVWEKRKEKEQKEEQRIEDEKYKIWESMFLKLSEYEKLIEISKIISVYKDSKSIFNSSDNDDSCLLEYNTHLSRYLKENKRK
jgi:hypothetical protein